jgi:hypothetical protein
MIYSGGVYANMQGTGATASSSVSYKLLIDSGPTAVVLYISADQMGSPLLSVIA